MDITVKYNKLLIAPRKIREILRVIKRGDRVPAAVAQLTNHISPSAIPIKKLLLASVSAAKDHKAQLQASDLMVKEFYCNEGARMYRNRLKGRGRASKFAKRGSHLTLVVSEASKAKTTQKNEKEISKTATKKANNTKPETQKKVTKKAKSDSSIRKDA